MKIFLLYENALYVLVLIIKQIFAEISLYGILALLDVCWVISKRKRKEFTIEMFSLFADKDGDKDIYYGSNWR